MFERIIRESLDPVCPAECLVKVCDVDKPHCQIATHFVERMVQYPGLSPEICSETGYCLVEAFGDE